MSSTPSQELKACPFCGGKPVLNHVPSTRAEPSNYFIRCSDCLCRTRTAPNGLPHSKQSAIYDWNSRPTPVSVEGIKEWNQYQRKGLSEMRPYIKGEDMTGISVSEVDDPENDMGMVARNPKNHADQWYVARKYFDENLEPVSRPTPVSLEGSLQRLKKRLENFDHGSWSKTEIQVMSVLIDGFIELVDEEIDSLTPHPDTPEPSGEEERPMCTECDEEMNPFGDSHSGVSGWSCDSCGWSWDNEPISPPKPEPSGEEWYTELIRLVGDLRDDFCDDNCLNVCDHFDSAPLSIGEKQLAHRWIAMYSKSVFDTSTEESNNDATEFLKGLEPNPVSPPKTDQESISEAVRDFARFYDGVTANGSSSMVDRFLTERFNHPPKTEGDKAIKAVREAMQDLYEFVASSERTIAPTCLGEEVLNEIAKYLTNPTTEERG